MNTLDFLSSVSIVMCTASEGFWGMNCLGGFDVLLLFWRMLKQNRAAISTVSFSTASLESAAIAPDIKDTNNPGTATVLLVTFIDISRCLSPQKHTEQAFLVICSALCRSIISLSKYDSGLNNLYYKGASCSFKELPAHHLLLAALWGLFQKQTRVILQLQ